MNDEELLDKLSSMLRDEAMWCDKRKTMLKNIPMSDKERMNLVSIMQLING